MKNIGFVSLLLFCTLFSIRVRAQNDPIPHTFNDAYNLDEVDSIPVFIGGNKALTAVCDAKLDGRSGLQKGYMTMKVIVEKDSTISNLEPISIPEEFSSAQVSLILDVIQSIKDGWVSAQLNGESVRCKSEIYAMISDTGASMYIDQGIIQKAGFIGWNTAMYRFISENIILGDTVIGGKVVVSFVIEKNGDVSNIEVLKVVGPIPMNQQQAAMDVVKAMSGMWIPAMQRDKVVRMRFSLPIQFVGYAEPSRVSKKKKR